MNTKTCDGCGATVIGWDGGWISIEYRGTLRSDGYRDSADMDYCPNCREKIKDVLGIKEPKGSC